MRTLAAHLPTFAQIQALLGQAEARRDAVLRDLDQRRALAGAGRFGRHRVRMPIPDDDEEI